MACNISYQIECEKHLVVVVTNLKMGLDQSQIHTVSVYCSKEALMVRCRGNGIME